MLFVIFVGSGFVHNENYAPFLPYGFAGIAFGGHVVVGQVNGNGDPSGVLAGAAIVFFAYIGFDAVSCQAEECKRPQVDLPIGIIGSLGISTVLYVAVSLVLVGMVSEMTFTTPRLHCFQPPRQTLTSPLFPLFVSLSSPSTRRCPLTPSIPA